MRNCRLPIFTLMLTLALPAARATELSVTLDATDIVRKHVHTDLVMSVTPGPLTLVYPKWIPGEHAPTGPLESMIGLTITANGKPVAWNRDPYDLYAFHLVVPPGAEQLVISLDSGLGVKREGFTAAQTSTDRLAVVSWNQYVLLPKGEDAEDIPTRASIRVPEGWSIASALATKRRADGGYDFEEASLTRLIDSPVQTGRYMKRVELAGSPPLPNIAHDIVIAADSPAALVLPDGFAAGYSRLIAEAGVLFGSRMYRHYSWLLTLSDSVAHFGLEHHESSDDRREENAIIDPDKEPWVSTLLAHEYVHSWNAKYRRPEGLLSPDYDKPMDDSMLWVYEGLTTFWGDVLPARAGLLTEDQFRDMLAESAAAFDNEAGADWRTLADTAVAAANLYSAPAAWRSSRRSTDFYAGSVFLWLDVDAEIRERTQGHASLDDFMRRFYAGDSGKPALKPYSEQDVYDNLAAVAPNDWRTFIGRHLHTTGTAALFAALDRSGWKLVYNEDKNAYIEVSQKSRQRVDRMWSIGMSLDKDAAVLDVVEDRAAAQAGVGPGMTLVAVNGRTFTADVLDTAIGEAKQSHEPIALLVQEGDFYRTIEVPYYDGARYPHLVRNGGNTDTLSKVLTARSASP
jgi:predicted metalloprotease with PDZ domain